MLWPPWPSSGVQTLPTSFSSQLFGCPGCSSWISQWWLSLKASERPVLTTQHKVDPSSFSVTSAYFNSLHSTILFLCWLLIYCFSATAKSLQSCPTVWPHRWQPTRLPHPWNSPGKNIGVGCHFLLQCVKVKSEREVAQSCPTLSDPMDCSPPGSSIHGILQARVLEWGANAFSLLSLYTH